MKDRRIAANQVSFSDSIVRKTVAAAAVLALIGLGAVWLVGVVLSAPVLQHVGNAPPSLGARSVAFQVSPEL